MANINLHFSKLQTYDELISDKEANSPGVYIWGFKRANETFVPYYVGESKNSIKNRIIDHFLHLNYANTYMVFKDEFLKKFEDQNQMLKRTGSVDQSVVEGDSLFGFLAYANKEVYMLENGGFENFVKGMSSQYVDLKRRDQSKQIQSIIEKHFCKENLLYSYSPFKLSENVKTPKTLYKYLEMVTKFSLKNNVVSQSSNFSPKLEPVIEISSVDDILKTHFHLAAANPIDLKESSYFLYK